MYGFGWHISKCAVSCFKKTIYVFWKNTQTKRALVSSDILNKSSAFADIFEVRDICLVTTSRRAFVTVVFSRRCVDITCIFKSNLNRIPKVEYPPDVVQCAVDMFKWKLEFGDKVGIKSESETVSRHSESVTYEDSASLYMGYPKGILSALSLHVKARCWR